MLKTKCSCLGFVLELNVLALDVARKFIASTLDLAWKFNATALDLLGTSMPRP